MKQLLTTIDVEVDYDFKNTFIDNGIIESRWDFLDELYREYNIEFTQNTINEILEMEENNICSFFDYLVNCGDLKDESHIHASYYERFFEFEHVFERGVNETSYLIDTNNISKLEEKLISEGIGIEIPFSNLNTNVQYLVGGFYGVKKRYNNPLLLYWIKNQADAILGKDLSNEVYVAYRYITKTNKNKKHIYFEA